MTIELTAIVGKVNGIEPVRNGFRQTVILYQPAEKDEFDRVRKKEQFFVINIFSNQQTDSRFLQPDKEKQKVKASLYLVGERWMNDRTRSFSYNHKLNLNQWLS